MSLLEFDQMGMEQCPRGIEGRNEEEREGYQGWRAYRRAGRGRRTRGPTADAGLGLRGGKTCRLSLCVTHLLAHMKDFHAAPLLLLLPYHSSTSAAEAAQRPVHIHHSVCFFFFFIVPLAQSRKQVVGRVEVCWGLTRIIADKVLWEHWGGDFGRSTTAARVFFHSHPQEAVVYLH